MIGLYLAIIMVWAWAVMVFAPARHMRGIVLLPVFMLGAVLLRCGEVVFGWAYAAWVNGWTWAFDKFDRWLKRITKGGA